MVVFILASIIIVMGLATSLFAVYYPIRKQEEIKDVEGKKDGEEVISLLRVRLLIIGIIAIASGVLIISEVIEVYTILSILAISVMAMMSFSNYYLEKKYNYREGIKIRE